MNTKAHEFDSVLIRVHSRGFVAQES